MTVPPLTPIRTALAVLAAAALLSACGSGDTPSTTTGAPARATSVQDEAGDSQAPSAEIGGHDDDDDAPATTTATPEPRPGSATSEVQPSATAEDPAATGDPGTSPPLAAEPAGPSKASFIAFADGVCLRFRSDVAAVDGSQRAREPAYRARRLSDLFGAAVQELTTHPRPRTDRAALRAYLLRLVDQRALLERLADATARRDEGAAGDARRSIDAVTAEARARARAYGLVVCGSPT